MERKLAVSMFGQKRLSREGGIEIVAKELCTRMVQNGCTVTCYNRSGHHVSGAEYDNKTEYEGICQKYVPTIEKKGLAAVSSSFFAAFYSAFGKYDVVHIHAEGPAFFAWLPKLFGKKVVVTIHGIDWQREKWKSGFGSKFIRQGEKNAVKYADEIIVLSKGVTILFMVLSRTLICRSIWQCPWENIIGEWGVFTSDGTLNTEGMLNVFLFVPLAYLGVLGFCQQDGLDKEILFNIVKTSFGFSCLIEIWQALC